MFIWVQIMVVHSQLSADPIKEERFPNNEECGRGWASALGDINIVNDCCVYLGYVYCSKCYIVQARITISSHIIKLGVTGFLGYDVYVWAAGRQC